MTEFHLKILRILSKNSLLSQRDIARKLDFSLGKVNYVLNELMRKGHIKMKRFKNSHKKHSYMYILTPDGLKRKMELTYSFLQLKSQEYEVIKQEIKELEQEIKTFHSTRDLME